MKRILCFAALSVFFLLPLTAQAADGYVTDSVNMRSGPDIGYPVVRSLRGGTSVSIQGCIDDWSWCDVIAYDDRGWVAGDYIEYEYESHRVLVPEYGVRIGLPIVSFVFGNYWDSYYRNRPWYHQRDRWSRWNFHRPPPPHRPTRPNPGHDRPTLPTRPNPGNHRPTPPVRPNPGDHRPTPPVRPNPGNQRPTPPARPNPGNHRPTPPARPNPGNNRPMPAARPDPGNNRPTPAARPNPGNNRPTPERARPAQAKPEKGDDKSGKDDDRGGHRTS